jgi:hypothetical protein
VPQVCVTLLRRGMNRAPQNQLARSGFRISELARLEDSVEVT